MLSQLRGRRIALPREANPVLVRELRSRFRGPRAFVLLTLYLLALTAVAALLLYGYRAGQGGGALGGVGSGEAGALLLTSLGGLQYLAITLVAPALTTSALSGERERETLELLLATPLSGAAIARGKVLAAMAFVALLAFSSLPAISVVFLLGGVSFGALLRLELGLLAIGLVYCALAALFSASTGRTGLATLLSYGSILFLGPLLSLLSWVFLGLLGLRLGFFGPGSTVSGYLPGLGMLVLLGQESTSLLPWAGTIAQLVLLFAILVATTGACIRPPSPRYYRWLATSCVLLYVAHLVVVLVYAASGSVMQGAVAGLAPFSSRLGSASLASLSPVFPIFLFLAMAGLVQHRWRRAR